MIGVDCPGVYEYVYRCAVHVYGAIVERAASGTAARAQRHGFTEHLRGGRRLLSHGPRRSAALHSEHHARLADHAR
jgi:hypothetical protein